MMAASVAMYWIACLCIQSKVTSRGPYNLYFFPIHRLCRHSTQKQSTANHHENIKTCTLYTFFFFNFQQLRLGAYSDPGLINSYPFSQMNGAIMLAFICINWIYRLIIHTELQSYLSDDTFIPLLYFKDSSSTWLLYSSIYIRFFIDIHWLKEMLSSFTRNRIIWLSNRVTNTKKENRIVFGKEEK